MEPRGVLASRKINGLRRLTQAKSLIDSQRVLPSVANPEKGKGDPLDHDPSQGVTVELIARQRSIKTHWHAYDVLLECEMIVVGSRDPETDLARALLARGYSGIAEVIDAETRKPRSRVDIAKAARLETIEGPYGPFWRRRQTLTDQTYAAERNRGDIGVAPDRFSSPEVLTVE